MGVTLETGSDATRRVFVLGEVGGRADLLELAIRGVGGDPVAGELPDSVTLIQLGGVAGSGAEPTDDEAIRLADRMARGSGGRWIQLWGRHEAMSLSRAVENEWRHSPLGAEGRAIAKRWWEEGIAYLAAAFTDERYGDLLVSHRGLTRASWLGHGEFGAVGTARSLNVLTEPAEAFGSNGPVWSGGDRPVADTWKRSTQPFGQVTAFGAAWNWSTGKFTTHADADLRARTRLHRDGRCAQTSVGLLADGAPAYVFSTDWRIPQGESTGRLSLVAFEATSLLEGADLRAPAAPALALAS